MTIFLLYFNNLRRSAPRYLGILLFLPPLRHWHAVGNFLLRMALGRFCAFQKRDGGSAAFRWI